MTMIRLSMSNCTINGSKNCQNNIQLKPENYKSIDEYINTNLNNQYFSKNFVKYLFDKGYCLIPLYKNKKIMYLKSTSDMANKNLYYYKGSNDDNFCEGFCAELEEYCQVTTQAQGTCYKNGILKTEKESYSPDPNINFDTKYNKLIYQHINSSMNLGIFKESVPGDVKKGTAEPGMEYTIESNKIGNGGSFGNAGEATQFGNLKANGGSFKTNTNIAVSLTNNTTISTISDLNKSKSVSICSISNINCNGSISDKLKELSQDDKIKINGNIEIKPAIYDEEENLWKDNSNPQKSTDDILKTGFGLFGASGSAHDCAIKYYPIKKLSYNDFEIKDNEKEAKIDGCSPSGHGMGGAIIIRWD